MNIFTSRIFWEINTLSSKGSRHKRTGSTKFPVNYWISFGSSDLAYMMLLEISVASRDA
jgi:hypothetical protein